MLSLINRIFRTVGESTRQSNPGVYVEYRESIQKSIRELDEMGVLPTNNDVQLKLKIKDGMDGAGHQLRMKGAEYPSMELFGYVLLEVYEISASVSLHYKVPLYATILHYSISYLRSP